MAMMPGKHARPDDRGPGDQSAQIKALVAMRATTMANEQRDRPHDANARRRVARGAIRKPGRAERRTATSCADLWRMAIVKPQIGRAGRPDK